MLKISEQANAVEEAVKVLTQLQLHHESMTKPHTSPVSKDWNKTLAYNAREALRKLKRAF